MPRTWSSGSPGRRPPTSARSRRSPPATPSRWAAQRPSASPRWSRPPGRCSTGLSPPRRPSCARAPAAAAATGTRSSTTSSARRRRTPASSASSSASRPSATPPPSRPCATRSSPHCALPRTGSRPCRRAGRHASPPAVSRGTSSTTRGRPRTEAAPRADGTHMATDLPTVPSPRDVAAPARRRRWPWVAAVAVLALLGALAWLALGLAGAARDTRAAAARARADLERGARELRAGDQAGARRAVRAAGRDLALADAAARRPSVRVAARLPVVSSPVADLRHLLAAGHVLTRTAGRAVTVQARLAGAGVFRDGRIDLAGVAATFDDATALLGELGRARAELDLRPLADVLGALPPAVGAAGPRTYLVAVSNSAELKAPGGAPLAIVLLRFERGQVSVLRRGAVTEQRLNLNIRWPFVAGDPWHEPGSTSLFTGSGLSPDFPTSGEEMLRAWQVLTGVHADGVIAVDPTALAGLVDATGPVTTAGYGTVRGADVVRLVLADSYRRYPDRHLRHAYNQQLMDAVLGRVLEGGKLLPKVRKLGAAAAGRHLQLYFRDRRLQGAARAHGLAGALSPAAQDYLGVFTVNTNASKVDYYQGRRIEQRVRLAADGSARVARAVRLANAAPPAPGDDSRTGYTTGWSRPGVAVYVPGGATGVSVRVDGKRAGWRSFRELGRRVVWVRLWLPPGSARTVTVSYRLSRAAAPTGNGLRYQLVADTQPIVHPATLRVVVVPPPGFAAAARPGWSAAGGALVTAGSLAGAATLNLDLQR